MMEEEPIGSVKELEKKLVEALETKPIASVLVTKTLISAVPNGETDGKQLTFTIPGAREGGTRRKVECTYICEGSVCELKYCKYSNLAFRAVRSKKKPIPA